MLTLYDYKYADHLRRSMGGLRLCATGKATGARRIEVVVDKIYLKSEIYDRHRALAHCLKPRTAGGRTASAVTRAGCRASGPCVCSYASVVEVGLGVTGDASVRM